MRIKTNIKPVDFDNVDGVCVRKCKTCAYKIRLLLEEKECEKASYRERGNRPHLCHNNHTKYCRGSYELSVELGLNKGERV